MSIDLGALRALSPAEKLWVIEILWNDLESAKTPLPIPKWMEDEADRRHAELLADPARGLSHEEIWRRLENLCE